MRIGLTYDLRSEYLAAGYTEEETAEFDRDDTIDSLEDALRQLGHSPDRIGNARRLLERLSQGERWDMVFNIAEGMRGVGRESQVPAILDLFEIPYTFSDPLATALTLHKGMAKHIFRGAGLSTPDFRIIENLKDLEKIHFPPPYFVKPVAEGTGKGISPASIIIREEDLKPACATLIRKHRQAVLVEAFLPGREFTVGIVGTGAKAEALGTLEVLLREGAEEQVYSYVNKERCEELVEYRLALSTEDEQVRQAEELALAGWRVLGCRDGGRADLRGDRQGKPSLLEINALAGLHPSHSDLPILCAKRGITYVQLIGRILRSAGERLATF